VWNRSKRDRRGIEKFETFEKAAIKGLGEKEDATMVMNRKNSAATRKELEMSPSGRGNRV